MAVVRRLAFSRWFGDVLGMTKAAKLSLGRSFDSLPCVSRSSQAPILKGGKELADMVFAARPRLRQPFGAEGTDTGVIPKQPPSEEMLTKLAEEQPLTAHGRSLCEGSKPGEEGVEPNGSLAIPFKEGLQLCMLGSTLWLKRAGACRHGTT